MDWQRCIGRLLQIRFTANRAIMETSLPYHPSALQSRVYRPRAARFGCQHQRRQRVVLQFDQPMKMVGHHHPGEGIDPFFCLRLTKVVYHQTSCPPVSKKRGAIPGDSCQQVDLAGLGITSGA
jgi:hypothetical protein